MVDSEETQMIKIKKAAKKLVFIYGVKGWNMDDCAREAGITKRTLYQYIDSKEKLVEMVLIGFIRETQQNLARELIDISNFQAGLEKILNIFPRMVLKMDSKIIQDIFKQYPTIEEHVIQERLSLAEEAINFIQKGQNQGILKKNIQPETILEILQSLVIYYTKNDPENFEEKLKEGFVAVLDGFLEK